MPPVKSLKNSLPRSTTISNVSSAWGVVFDWVRDCNRRLAENQMDAATAATELAAWERIDAVLGVGKAEEKAPAELNRAARRTRRSA